MADHEPISTREEILILLEEYTSLRTEILQRNSVLNQCFTIFAAVAIAALGLLASHVWLIGLIIIVLAPPIVFMVWRLILFDTLKAAGRVREIEAAVNEIAGKRLMVWETDHGLPKVGRKPRWDFIKRGRIDSNEDHKK